MPDQFLHGIETKEIDDGIRPIRTVTSSVIGIVGTAPDADADLFPLDTPVLLTGPRAAAALGAGGTLKDDYDAIYSQGVNIAIVVRVEEGLDEAATLANVVGDVGLQSGCYALMLAQSLTGLTPRILCAPGFTGIGEPALANPAIGALTTVAARLRGIVVADGPNTTEADAIAMAGNHGSDRVFIADPAVRVFDTATNTTVTRPASGYVAGLISKRDREKGFWWSPSNQVVTGISGTARPISFQINSPDTEANRLNEANIATIVRKDGFRLWGNRSTGSDPLWTFLSVRRSADMIYESIEQTHLWAMDRPFSEQLLRDIRDTVQSYINTLVSRGALLGGRVWLDPELNTEATLKAGQLYMNYDIEPPAPLERLTFMAYRNGEYYDQLVRAVAAA